MPGKPSSNGIDFFSGCWPSIPPTDPLNSGSLSCCCFPFFLKEKLTFSFRHFSLLRRLALYSQNSFANFPSNSVVGSSVARQIWKSPVGGAAFKFWRRQMTFGSFESASCRRCAGGSSQLRTGTSAVGRTWNQLVLGSDATSHFKVSDQLANWAARNQRRNALKVGSFSGRQVASLELESQVGSLKVNFNWKSVKQKSPDPTSEETKFWTSVDSSEMISFEYVQRQTRQNSSHPRGCSLPNRVYGFFGFFWIFLDFFPDFLGCTRILWIKKYLNTEFEGLYTPK